MLWSQFWIQLRDSNAWNYTHQNKKMGYIKIFAFTRLISYLLNRIEIPNTSGISNTMPKPMKYNRSPTNTFDN